MIWLASYPRSGTTYFRLCVKAITGVDTFTTYREHSSPVDKRGGLEEFTAPAEQDLQFMLVKTHGIAEAQDRVPAIQIVRDGRDAVVSFAHYLEWTAGKTVQHWLNLLVDGALKQPDNHSRYCLNWSESVEIWQQRQALTHTVYFDDLVQRPIATVLTALDALGINHEMHHDPQIPTFPELHATNPGFYRAGRSGSWVDAMTPDQHQRFWDNHGTAMQALEMTTAC